MPSDSSPGDCIPVPIHLDSPSLLKISLMRHSAEVLSMLSMMHTTARPDCKEMLVKKHYTEAGWKGGMATIVWGLYFSYGQQLYCDKSSDPATTMRACKSTAHPIVASGSPFEVCPSPDMTPYARLSSQPVQTC